jgi:hypothetical protein
MRSMRNRMLRRGPWLCTLLLGACVEPVTLIQLDNELTRTYAAKIEMERADAETAIMLTGGSSLELQFADLSRRAESHGDAARAKDPATAVGFYRVAAASGWKAGRLREDVLLSIRDKGVDACEALPNRDASQPRDCTFIRLVPQLALFDVKAREIQSLAVATSLSDAQRARIVELARQITGDQGTVGLIGDLAAMQQNSASLPLPESFGDYIGVNINREFCAAIGMNGVLARNAAPQAQLDTMTNLIQGAETKLHNVGVSTTCL